MAFMYKKITKGGYSFYIHILKVPVLPTLLLQESSTRSLSWPINMTEYGNGEAVDTEQFRNVQESERYETDVSGTKKGNMKGYQKN